MGLFNFNKKKKFLSKLSSDQRDEITITLILMKQMIDADGVDKPEEKEYYKKYLINCGISSKEELEFILDRAGNLTSDQYDTIVHDFDEFQKLTILQELYGIICSDNEINQDELDLLFHISRDMGIDDDIIVDMLGAKGDLLEKFNESRSDSKSISNLDKFCSECGNQFESDQKFCPNCGNKRNIAELDEGELKDKVETDQENKQKIIEESKFSFNKVQALKQIELNWIKGISPIYSVSLTELFENPGRTICYYKTDEESDFYEGEHISIIVKSISEGKDLIDFVITQNGENVSFLSIDNDRIIHKLGYLFDISLVEPEDFDFPIVEINRRKKLEYISGTGEEILHGIHLKSDSIKTKIKGFKKLILNNGELVADGRYTSDSDAQKIDSWHSDFSTAFDDVNQVLEVNDPANEFLKLNIEEAKNKIIDSGFSYKAENFEMNFYKGNSSWWVNFNLN